MTSVGTDKNSSESENLPFPNLPLLQGYADDIRKSVKNPSLQATQIDFLMMNVFAVLDALQTADNVAVTLTSELESLKESHAKLEIRCNQTCDNNGWLNERYNETRKVNEDLLETIKKLKSKLSVTSVKEKHMIERMTWMEQAIRKLSGLIIKNRVGSYQSIELWVNQALSKPLDHVAEQDKSTDFGKPSTLGQEDGMNERKPRGGSIRDKAAVDNAGPDSNFLTEKLWDDAFTNVTGPELNTPTAKSDGTASRSVSDLSIFTNVIISRIAQNKASREVKITTEKKAAIERENQDNKSVANAICDSRTKEDAPVEIAAASTTIKRVEPDTLPMEVVSDKSSVGHVDENVSSEQLAVNIDSYTTQASSSPPINRSQQRSFNNQHRNSPPINRFRRRPTAEFFERVARPQIINTCEDNTKYADIALGNSYYADAINPQVVVADPDEVAGDWNDVPVPIELRRLKAPPEKIVEKTFERNVFMAGLPPTITVGMLAAVVRGGKIESIYIVDQGKKVGMRSAVISFFSRSAARRLIRWMVESPPLYIDRYIARPSIAKAVAPPIVPHGGGSRVVIIKNIPGNINDDESFWKFVHKTADRYQCKIKVQETHIWPVDANDEERGLSGVVIFESYHMGLDMHRIFKQRLNLEVRWGRDRCEDPLGTQKLYEFVEYKKKKQYDSESD